MAKYDVLAEHLQRRTGKQLRLSFAEIDDLVPGGLPASARNHSAWWANESVGSHVQARAWMGAGWRVDCVDLLAGSVIFVAEVD